MSSIVNKVKDALHSDKKHEQPEGTSGPHSSKAANAADPRVDSDRDHRANPAGATGTTGTHTTGTHGTTGTTGTTGAHTHSSNTATGYDDPAGTHGPHSSKVANQADPRVDSDRDHRGAPGSGLTGTHGTTGTTGSGLTGSHGTTGTTTGSGITGSHGTTMGSGLTGSHGTTGTTTGSGLTGTHGATTGYDDPAGTHGPHGSRAANQADPRVDSDRDHRGAPGSGLTGTHGTTGTTTGSGLTGSHGTTGTTTGSGLTGSHGTTGTHGTTGGSTGTGVTGSHGTHGTSGEHTGLGKVGAAVGGTHGTGPAPNTAGPHKSDMLNKADPRVDSDLDGSKTVGGNKTYAQSNTTGVAKDPTDAAQVPPSVLAKHIGEPSIEHADHGHDRQRRNSKVSAQELHRGL